MLTDLFGHPIARPIDAVSATPRRHVSKEAKRSKLLRHLERSSNLMLFNELLDFLKAPLMHVSIPAEFASDVGEVAVVEAEDAEEDDEGRAASTVIPYSAWGEPWVTDAKSLAWSEAALNFLQVRLFWRSMEELSLSNNEQEKWSVLKWVFRRAWWKYYVFDKRIGRSHCFAVHERDEPFGFHNCCMAVRMDEDLVREGVRRNVPAEVVKAVERVCSFD